MNILSDKYIPANIVQNNVHSLSVSIAEFTLPENPAYTLHVIKPNGALVAYSGYYNNDVITSPIIYASGVSFDMAGTWKKQGMIESTYTRQYTPMYSFKVERSLS